MPPTDLGKFREWADRECGAWPSDLQIKAYEVCLGKRSLEDFKTSWMQWRG